MGLFKLLCWSREFAQTLEQNRARLYRIAYSWTHQAALADDLVQETLTKALQKSAQLRDPSAQNAWLFSILANCYRDHFRRYREMDDIDEIELASDIGPESDHMQNEIVNQVRAAVAKLPLGQRQVVTLVDLEGFSYAEVTGILTIPIGTVMSRLCRARATLKEILLPQLGSNQDRPVAKIRRIK